MLHPVDEVIWSGCFALRSIKSDQASFYALNPLFKTETGCALRLVIKLLSEMFWVEYCATLACEDTDSNNCKDQENFVRVDSQAQSLLKAPERVNIETMSLPMTPRFFLSSVIPRNRSSRQKRWCCRDGPKTAREPPTKLFHLTYK